MKRLLAALLGLCLAASAYAAGPTATLPADSVLRGKFVQERHLAGFTNPLRSSGGFTLSPGHGLIWRTEQPFPMVTAITPKGLVQSAGNAETLRLSAGQVPFLGQLYAMFDGALSGDWHPLEADFAVARSGTDAAWSIELTPKGKVDPAVLPFKTIAAKGSTYVEQVTLTRANGDSDVLSFSGQAASGAPLSAEEAADLATVGR